MERDFKGVWIPKEIWLSGQLSLIEKCLWVEIDSLDKGEAHCYAGNDHLSDFLGCSTSTVIRALIHLENLELIFVTRQITQHGTKRIMRAARLPNWDSRESQNDTLLVIPEESNTKKSPESKFATRKPGEYKSMKELVPEFLKAMGLPPLEKP